jgi:hypothetical protein
MVQKLQALSLRYPFFFRVERSAWLRLLRYVAEMAAVEYGKCPSIHTSRLARFEYDIRVLEIYLFSPDLNWNVLRTQNLASKYG